MSSLQYLNATLSDLPAIVRIYNSTISSRMVTADTEPVSVDSRNGWFDQHNSETCPLWLVKDGSDLIGWVSFQSFYGRPAYNGTAEISIYLDESSRGKGYGKQIIEHSIEACSALQIKTLLAFIFGHNEVSVRLFIKAGFTEWGHFPRIATLDGVERDLVILGKRVNQ